MEDHNFSFDSHGSLLQHSLNYFQTLFSEYEQAMPASDMGLLSQHAKFLSLCSTEYEGVKRVNNQNV